MGMGVTYLCANNGVFITTGFAAMRICILHLECSWPRKAQFDPFYFGVGLIRDVEFLFE